MISNEIQERIHNGDMDAFRVLYAEYSKAVYNTAFYSLKDDEKARQVVKEVFLTVYDELHAQVLGGKLDARFTQITADCIRTMRLTEGDLNSRVETPRVIGKHETVAAPTRREQPVIEDVLPQSAKTSAPVQENREDEATRLRAEALEREAALPPTKKDDPLPEASPKRGGVGFVLLTALIVLLLIGLLWIAVGIMMNLGWLPAADLGYQWFDSHLFPLFS